ncbi:MAG: hypothetical protein AABW50_02775 [Nanoarchaeota archaeon]
MEERIKIFCDENGCARVFNNPQDRFFLSDLEELNRHNGKTEKDRINYNGKSVIFEGWAIENPSTGFIPKSAAVLGYEASNNDYERIKDSQEMADIEKLIRERWGERLVRLYFIS